MAYNELSDATAERLAMLIEECGEVIQIAGKILRHGMLSAHPSDPSVNNMQLLSSELTDVICVADQLSIRDGLVIPDRAAVSAAWKRKLRYAHHQDENKSSEGPRVMGSRSIKISYKNYRGEVSVRTISPVRIWWGSTQFHPEEQWLMAAYDYGKKDYRDFALKDMVFLENEND